MSSVNLFGVNTFVFIVVMVVVLTLLIVYRSIAPEDSVPYNFSPFPTLTPSQLPEPNRPTDKCWNTLTPCDSSGECSGCSLGEYKCVTVSKEEAENKFYNFNGISVPEGKWCLPKDANPNPVCNSFTGRWLWVFDPEYCNSVSPGHTQCWKCDCLYPNLFTDSKNGCNTNIACQNGSMYSSSVTQPDNKLKATNNAKPSIRGKVWDPTSSSRERDDSDLYRYTPYDKTKSGEPLFKCDCDAKDRGQDFATLPGDPYTCHLEPCYKSVGYHGKGLSCSSTGGEGGEGGECKCLCDGAFATSPEGKFKGTCVLISNACTNYGYDNDKNKCLCGEGPYWERKCRNEVTGVNVGNKDLPRCTAPQNALGTECVNPCGGKVCNNGAPCISCGPDSWKSSNVCAISSDGRDLERPDEVHSICQCTATTFPPPPGYGGWFGESCDKACLAGDTTLRKFITGKPTRQTCYGCSCCCSGDYHNSGEVWLRTFKSVCTGGNVLMGKKPNPECLPLTGNCQNMCPE